MGRRGVGRYLGRGVLSAAGGIVTAFLVDVLFQLWLSSKEYKELMTAIETAIKQRLRCSLTLQYAERTRSSLMSANGKLEAYLSLRHDDPALKFDALKIVQGLADDIAERTKNVEEDVINRLKKIPIQHGWVVDSIQWTDDRAHTYNKWGGDGQEMNLTQDEKILSVSWKRPSILARMLSQS